VGICLCIAIFATATVAATVQVNERFNISSEVTAVGGIPASVRISDVSSDGSVVIGRFSKNKVRYDDWQVFRYVRGRRIEDLGPLAKDINTLCVSGDGAVMWGSFYVKDEGSRLFRYTQSHGLEDLGAFGRMGIHPYAASADGAVVVGSFRHTMTPENKPIYHAFRYSERDGFQDLGSMGAESAFARGVSANGSVIVGNFHVANSNDHAFHYSRAAGVDDLGAIGGTAAFATGSADNGLVVGTFFGKLDFYRQAYDNHVFIYTRSAGAIKLGAMGGKSAGTVRVSADGRRLVGSYTTAARESYLYIGTVQ
jgi:probable HAF family extracellular repeat protein